MRISDWSSDVCSSDLVGGRRVGRDLAVDLGAARLGVLQFLQHQDTTAAGNDEAVTVAVVVAAGPGRLVVVSSGQLAHGVEQHREGPVQLLASTCEDDVLLAHLDQLAAVADTMGRGRAGGGEGIAERKSTRLNCS